MGTNWSFKNLSDEQVDSLAETYAAWIQACAKFGMGSVEEAKARRQMDTVYCQIKTDVARRKLMSGIVRGAQ